MGNCCSGGKEESKKTAAFQTAEESDNVYQSDPHSFSASGLDGLGDSSGALSSQQLQQGQGQTTQQQADLRKKQGEAQLKALREEQNRLDLIVQMAGRGMVSVRSTRGSTGYYDQGFAAALGQHLEQTTKFPDQLPIRLPPYSKENSSKASAATSTTAAASTTADASSSSASQQQSSAKQSTVFQRLSQPQWENIALGKNKTGTGLAGCDGENPNTYMDHIAVSFLDSVVPKKERIFAGGVGPMVENLL